ncbi:MAG: dihydrodipicolinate synthase family protein [Alphaproteobacteria bacterium]|nr:dihydrodipicolinate synthase family protein [Alphaproteobacteria bacterium]
MSEIFGVYPAATTQFNDDSSLNLEATQNTFDNLIKDGVHGLIIMGTCGENNSLHKDEKLQILAAAKEVVAGRVPVYSGVSEFTTKSAIEFAQNAEKIGLDGLMVLPAMSYKASKREVITHYKSVANSTALPIMIYNNPISYGIDVTIDMLKELASVKNITAIKESTEDTRRITDLYNQFDDRFTIFCGVDDIALESIMLGTKGWISGLTSAFPAESVAIWDLAQQGRYKEAMEIYRWFMPLLHLDTIPTLVQCIKLCEQICGRGSEMVRAPRLKLEGAERQHVIDVTETALKTRPDLSKYK